MTNLVMRLVGNQIFCVFEFGQICMSVRNVKKTLDNRPEVDRMSSVK